MSVWGDECLTRPRIKQIIQRMNRNSYVVDWVSNNLWNGSAYNQAVCMESCNWKAPSWGNVVQIWTFVFLPALCWIISCLPALTRAWDVLRARWRWIRWSGCVSDLLRELSRKLNSQRRISTLGPECR